MPEKPVFVITGPSGAGKGTLEAVLLARMPDELALAVSATTRPRRPGERDGRDYHFLSDEEFDRRLALGEFLEYVTYVSGHRYGTLRSELEQIAASGRAAVLDLEIEGALTVRDAVPGAVTIFVDASLAELERRLRERATESAGEIGERVALAREQKRRVDEFDHVVVNDELERASRELQAIVSRELAAAATMPT
ncbi:MAG: guanylate kinase [Thermoleophilia bacterium]|nr:guanylate kinase [Thermoleophilia bacterium]